MRESIGLLPPPRPEGRYRLYSEEDEQRLQFVLRAKGIVRFAGRDWHALFNFTCGRHEITWIRLDEAGGESQAVFIGRGLEGLRERIEAGLAACEVDEERRTGHA